MSMLPSPDSPRLERDRSFGEVDRLTPVDRFGVWLSVRQIRRWLPSKSDLVIGDIGSGYHARLARALLPRAHHLYLADVSLAPDLLSNPRVTALQGVLPGTLATIPDEAVDLVLCISVLEHVREPDALVHQLRRMLKPGGTALINVPSWRGKRYLEFSAFRLGLSPAREMDDHKMYYDVRDLWPLLVRAGFLPSRIRCFPHKFGLNTFAICQKERGDRVSEG